VYSKAASGFWGEIALGLRTVALLATVLAAPVFAQTDLGEEALTPEQAEAKGFDYWLGRGVERDLAEAVRWLEKAAAAGRPQAAALLADLYSRGDGVQRDDERARELDLQAAALGVSPSEMRLGYAAMYPQDPAARDPAAAVPWLKAAAEQDHPMALYLLGQLYFSGQGVEADAELGWRLFTRAAELGYPPASAEAGRHLLVDDAAADDVQRGLYFLNKAASSAYAPGEYYLAKVYLNGRHVAPDVGAAARLLTHASERDYGPATFWLAELYAKGLGVEADAGRAAELRGKVVPTMPVGVRNEFAWELAVSPTAELRDGAFAVEIMEGATAERLAPAYIDTLAAAYAEAGRFEDAVRAQQRAIDALPRDASATSRDVFVERLELYRAGQPYREAQ
jgi:TPR repeat protein